MEAEAFQQLGALPSGLFAFSLDRTVRAAFLGCGLQRYFGYTYDLLDEASCRCF